jgi:hypothetical protein
MINLKVVLAKAVVAELVTGLVIGVIILKTAYKNEEEE